MQDNFSTTTPPLTPHAPVTVVPAAAVRLPRPETDPAEVGLAVLVLADHVVAAAVLLDGHVALRALLRVRRDPVGRLRVVVAFLQKHNFFLASWAVLSSS